MSALPSVVAHADWSTDPRKRWMAVAVRDTAGSFRATAPELVGDLATLFARLTARADTQGAVLLGVDCPIGVPRRWAARADVTDFRALLPELGRGAWADFFWPAATPDEIGLRRPFYPYRSNGKRRAHLVRALGAASFGELNRRCELAGNGRRAACVLFWTLGSNQVGKAAIVCWRDLIAPSIQGGLDLGVWPYDGDFADLLATRAVVVAETYPAEVYRHFDLAMGRRRGSKTNQADRRKDAPKLTDVAAALGVTLAPDLDATIADGFGSAKGGDDPFDATVGLFGMLNVVRGRRPSGEPDDDPAIRSVEGWIFGQAAVST